MKLTDKLKELADEIEEAWSNEVAQLQDANNKLTEKIGVLEAEVDAIHAEADALHEAICEGRRQDAIDLLNQMTDGSYRSVAEQRNLFPDRIPE